LVAKLLETELLLVDVVILYLMYDVLYVSKLPVAPEQQHEVDIELTLVSGRRQHHQLLVSSRYLL
jgi:hypothetical protein